LTYDYEFCKSQQITLCILFIKLWQILESMNFSLKISPPNKFGGGTQAQDARIIFSCLCEERSDEANSCLDKQIASPAKAGSQ